MSRVFEYPVIVTIADTNMEGNVYWTNFCVWFGKARELFLIELLPQGVSPLEFLMNQRLSIITCDVAMRFIKSAFFADRLVVKINTANFKGCSVDIISRIMKISNGSDGSEELIATGRQKLAFCSSETKRFIPITEELKRVALQYKEDEEGEPETPTSVILDTMHTREMVRA